MRAIDLYNQLESDFVTPEITENWFDDKESYDASIDKYICDNFKRRSMGLLCDFTEDCLIIIFRWIITVNIQQARRWQTHSAS